MEEEEEPRVGGVQVKKFNTQSQVESSRQQAAKSCLAERERGRKS